MSSRLSGMAARSGPSSASSSSSALSGGSGPWQSFQLLADEDVPWQSVEIFQVDDSGDDPGELAPIVFETTRKYDRATTGGTSEQRVAHEKPGVRVIPLSNEVRAVRDVQVGR